jgi:PelA/Pel-15E family pectate lyase
MMQFRQTVTAVRTLLWILLIGLCACSHATLPWKHYQKKGDDWFAGSQGKEVLENILSWQDEHGGWPKNEDTDTMRFTGAKSELRGTFDNGATTGEMRILARGYRVTGDERYKAAFLKAFEMILKAQYPTGGWPQYWPLRKGYYSHITFNDAAMVRLMELLDEIAKDPGYAFVGNDRRAAARAAFDRGVECILNCQIRVNGKLMVWCAQHDAVDFSPRPARSYELVSLSGGESAGILRMLMRLDKPSVRVAEAIAAGVQWYRDSEVHGLRIEWVDGMLKAVPDANAKPLWARFYEIETNRPFFCDRDGIPKYDYNLIDQERSTGYAWYGSWGQDVYNDFAKWKKDWGYLLAPGATRLLIVGDSTVCEYSEDEVRRGWGQYLQGYFKDELTVVNHARSGRSTKTFMNEGLWKKAIETKPAYVLIQFGHNDSHDPGKPESTDAATDFRNYLRTYIDEAQALGAVPILVTPMFRRKFDAQGNITDNLKPYAEAMKLVAAEKKVPLVDLQGASEELYLKLGPEKTAEFANAPDDRTHFNAKGAQAMAELVMTRLPEVEPSLKAFLRQN